MENSVGLTALSDFDDEDTTDTNDGCHSDTDGSVVLTASESDSSARVSGAARRCRFGGTALETIPATPVSATVCSPPGLSRAAMRQERDQYKMDATPATVDGEKLYALSANKSDLGLSECISGRQCRFGSSQMCLDTVPKTPIGAGSYQTLLAPAIRSPPGLSHASLRQERDACNATALSGTSWGRCQQSAGEAKSLDASAVDGQRCYFAGASLRTVPVVAGVGSPPGLSRAALRQSRDARMAGGFQATSWGGYHVAR